MPPTSEPEKKPTRSRKPAEKKEEAKPEAARRPRQATQSSKEGAVTEGSVPQLELFVPEQIKDEELAKLNVYQRWNRIIGEMGIIPKRGWNDHHHYWFTTDADLNAFVGPLFAKYHLVVIPTITKVERFDPAPNKNLYLTRVSMHISVINADKPEDRFEVDWIGEGGDTIDKGVYKSFTGGLKYFYMKLLQVATGDDPEVFTRTDKLGEGRTSVETLSEGQANGEPVEVRTRARKQPEKGGHQQETTEAQIKALSNLSVGLGYGPRGTAEVIDEALGTHLTDTLAEIDDERAQRHALVEFLKTRPGTDTGKVIYQMTQIATKAAELRSQNAAAAAQTDYVGAEDEEALIEQARAEVSADNEALDNAVAGDETAPTEGT